jgi:hypothetical protein
MMAANPPKIPAPTPATLCNPAFFVAEGLAVVAEAREVEVVDETVPVVDDVVVELHATAGGRLVTPAVAQIW